MRLTLRFFVFACLLAVPVTVLAQTPDGITARVDAIFAAYDKPDSPGCALGVIKDGKIIYSRGYGMSNLEHNIPNRSKLIYDIGSTSKQFTPSYETGACLIAPDCIVTIRCATACASARSCVM